MPSFEDMEAADLDICDRLDLLSGESRSEGAGSVSSESSFYAESISCGPVTSVRLTSPTSFAVLFRRCRDERDALYSSCSSSSSSLQVEDRSGQGELNPWTEVLCAERVSQMTKTYNDIEAVTRLLEEKERDLELAARIGQTLLSKNKELSSRAECLEEQLGQATERVNQLRHEMGMKDELLRFYNEDLERDGGGDTPTV
ncbi:trafficking kinesin-binding protein 1 [Plakobranchus ocellatus]|uniref:Trafficking kinesin-binding protein 1 n=1 Tax=Plakobranchus ocellatus TaxID=259542 RepID=A0AAV4A3R1_9GAST|nr:trafficking kinesin-binding protein 1 [Plakobranchus ocellatus]